MGFAAESRKRIGPMIPLTALVDVLFLLLIFFVALPVLSDAQEPAQSENVPPYSAIDTVDAMEQDTPGIHGEDLRSEVDP